MAELRELSLQVPSALLSLATPPTSSAFKLAEYAKFVQIDARDPAKIM
jgi:hypothetical protein